MRSLVRLRGNLTPENGIEPEHGSDRMGLIDLARQGLMPEFGKGKDAVSANLSHIRCDFTEGCWQKGGAETIFIGENAIVRVQDSKINDAGTAEIDSSLFLSFPKSGSDGVFIVWIGGAARYLQDGLIDGVAIDLDKKHTTKAVENESGATMLA